MNVLAHFNPPGYSSIGVVNTRAWRSAQMPVHERARHRHRARDASTPRCCEPDALLSPDLLDDATAGSRRGRARSSARRSRSDSGSCPPTRAARSGPNPRSFGHFGTGGALGFADPDTGIAFGYVMNHVIPRWRSARNQALVEAVYDAL